MRGKIVCSLLISVVGMAVTSFHGLSDEKAFLQGKNRSAGDRPAAAFRESLLTPAKSVVRSAISGKATPKAGSRHVSSESVRTAANLTAESTGKADVLWSVATGTPASLRGPFGEKSPDPPRRIARDFLKKHHGLFSLKRDLSDLSLVQSSESPAGHHVVFQQLYDGVPVEGGKIKVHVLKDGRVQSVRSHISPRLGPQAQVSVSREEGIEVAKRYLGLAGSLRGPIVAEKVVLPEPPPGTFVWKVCIPASQPCGDWVVMVDAENGAVLSARDIRMFATGEGNVFDPNPVVALQTTSLSDQGDSASAIPQAAYTKVILENLDGTGYLRGPYVDTALTTNRVFSAALDFSYDRSQRGFEEVMVYYHVQQFQNYLQNSLGLSLDTRQVLADAHATQEDSSWYSPLIRAIYFGDGGVDDGEDGYLVIHEYVHAVAYDVVREPAYNTECGALNEGMADYFAASLFADRDFMSETVAQWDGINNNPLGLRQVNSTKVYPTDIVGQEHDDGEIWSAALWELRKNVGREVADKLVANSVYYLDGSSQFSDGLEALSLADEALYQNAHATTISTTFQARGILRRTPMSLGESRSGTLIAGDLVMTDGSYYDEYDFAGVTGQNVKILLTSGEFDAYLVLLDPFFNILAQGDDLAGGSSNSQIVIRIPYGGTYHILATSYSGGETGQYSVTLSNATASDGTPQRTSMPYGGSVSGHLDSGDLAFMDGTYYDEYTFAGHVGQEIRISVSSSMMDAYLILYNADGDAIADSSQGYDVFISYTLPEDGDYSVAANKFTVGTGDYVLSLASLDPNLNIGRITSGELKTGDLQMVSDGSLFDAYQFQGTAGQALSIKLYSTEFDPYLIVYSPYYSYYAIIEVDDVDPGNPNIVVEELTIDVPGTYFVFANSSGPGETGRYKLSVFPTSITDTDSDGYSDRVEFTESTNPLDPSDVPADVDGDFIPDSMDPDNDNDGMPNLAELVAGTDPLDPTSVFRMLGVGVEGPGVTLRWSSVPGRHYAVYRTSDFLDWTLAQGDVPSQGEVTMWTEQDTTGEATIFYRAEVLPAGP